MCISFCFREVSEIKNANKTLREAAAETGISYELLRKYKNKQRRPRIENMLILRNWTNGAVTADDWYMPANDNKPQDQNRNEALK